VRKLYVLLLAMLVLLCSCGQKSAERQLYIMDTVVDISVFGETCQDTLNRVEAMLNRVDAMCSPTDAESEVNKINASAAEVSEELRQILTAGQKIHGETDGAFDITLGSLIDLWDIGGENHIPSEEEIAAASALCGSHRLEVGADFARVKSGTVVNLGGIAKGYAASKAMEIFEEDNVSCALLSIGGNICAKGTKADGSAWKVGVRDPKGTAAEYIGVLDIQDTVIAVSGDYERYFEKGGVRYHHILDAATGSPAQSDIRSVSVICRNGMRADALSTALFVMGKEKALDFWRVSDDFECIIVDDTCVTVTDGISDKFRLTDGRYTLETACR